MRNDDILLDEEHVFRADASELVELLPHQLEELVDLGALAHGYRASVASAIVVTVRHRDHLVYAHANTC
jgi:hypothetical protein